MAECGECVLTAYNVYDMMHFISSELQDTDNKQTNKKILLKQQQKRVKLMVITKYIVETNKNICECIKIYVQLRLAIRHLFHFTNNNIYLSIETKLQFF